MEESLSHRTLKNASWQVFNLGWATVLNFFVTPILLKQLGLENYGVYILILTVISFLSLAELGTGTGFTRSFLEYSSQGRLIERNKLVDTFFTYWIATGFIGAGTLLVASESLMRAFRIQSFDSRWAFYFGAGFFFVTMVNALFLGIISALQRFDIMGKVVAFQNTALNGLLVLFAFFTPSVSYLLLATFAVGVFTIALYAVFTRQVFPELRLRFAFDPGAFKAVFRFSFFNFVNGLANNAVLQIDRFFISRILSPATLPQYVVPNNLSQKIYSVSNSAGAVLFPVASRLSFSDEREKFMRAYRRSMRFTILFSLLSGIVLFLFGHEILYFWVGEAIAGQGSVLLYYFIPIYVLMSIGAVLNNFLLGLGRAAFLSVVSASMAVIDIVGLIIFLPRYGITGAAMAYLLSTIPILVSLVLFEKERTTIREACSFYVSVFGKIFIVSIPLFFYSLLSKQFVFNIWTALGFAGAGFVGIMVLYWLIGFFDSDDYELIKTFLHGRKSQ